MPTFPPVTCDLIERFRLALGPEAVLGPDEDLSPFARDETEGLEGRPEVVLCPRATEQVEAALRLAFEAGVPTTARSGGTGLSGGAVPVHGGVVLSFDRMDRILEIDEANLCAVVQPGVVTQTVQERVEARGVYYPPGPACR
ncbi:MAG: FAD-binding oxidoreductase, partial [Planctomycetota bacterium]